MKFKNLLAIISILVICFCNKIVSQTDTKALLKPSSSYIFTENRIYQNDFLSVPKYPNLSDIFSKSNTNLNFQKQPSYYCFADLAFFCKMEVQIEKAAKIPFKFRLGDVRYVDYLEQKTDFQKF